MSLLRRPGSPATPTAPLVQIVPDGANWRFVHFAAYRLPPGAALEGTSGALETALLVLGGRACVNADDREFAEVGRRRDQWERVPPALVLLGPGTPYRVEARTDLHLVVAGAESAARRPPRLVAPDEMLVEARGGGQTARTVHHVLPPGADAARLIIFEVFTAAGNWSSFPPHKHDTADPPRESVLEEVYYYGINPPGGFALQRVYTPARDLDEAIAAQDGDLVLVPRGYHVVAATPGYACYYLNVMAGPQRAWNFTLDPAYAHLMDWQPPTLARGSAE